MCQQGWLSLRAEVALQGFLPGVCLVQKAKAIHLLPGLSVSVSLPEASVVLLTVACAPACLLNQVKLPAFPWLEPFDPRQLLPAGCLLHEPRLQSGEERSSDSPF